MNSTKYQELSKDSIVNHYQCIKNLKQLDEDFIRPYTDAAYKSLGYNPPDKIVILEQDNGYEDIVKHSADSIYDDTTDMWKIVEDQNREDVFYTETYRFLKDNFINGIEDNNEIEFEFRGVDPLRDRLTDLKNRVHGFICHHMWPIGLGSMNATIQYEIVNEIHKESHHDTFRQNRNIPKAVIDFQEQVWLSYNTEKVQFIKQNPIFNFDSEYRLHSLSKPAIELNGKQVYAIKNVVMEKELWTSIVNKRLSVKEILQLKNIEHRMAAFEVHGSDELLKHAKMIDRSRRGNELYLIGEDHGWRKDLVLLKYTCPSTARVYTSFVPDHINSADQAMAWKFNMTEKEYSELRIEA